MMNRFSPTTLACLCSAAVALAALTGCGTGSTDQLADATAERATTAPPSAAASVAISLTGSDVETCELEFAIGAASNGTVSAITDEPCQPGTPNSDSAKVTFTAHPGVCGPRQGSFTYTTSDGSATSAPATVTVDIPCIQVGVGEQ